LRGHKGINAFIVEKGWPGFDIGVKEKKMGIRGSDTHSLMFSDVKVPKKIELEKMVLVSILLWAF
jgi:alkylation response protein AidB-like acyl-CoA dehydrogenase